LELSPNLWAGLEPPFFPLGPEVGTGVVEDPLLTAGGGGGVQKTLTYTLHEKVLRNQQRASCVAAAGCKGNAIGCCGTHGWYAERIWCPQEAMPPPYQGLSERGSSVPQQPNAGLDPPLSIFKTWDSIGKGVPGWRKQAGGYLPLRCLGGGGLKKALKKALKAPNFAIRGFFWTSIARDPQN